MKTASLGKILFWTLIPAVAACGGEDTGRTPMPLPVAWPRLPVSVSDSMTTLSDLPVAVRINPSATYSIVAGETPGLTVTYPKAGASIYYTFISAPTDDARQKVLEARKERISLNLNGLPARTIHSATGNGALIVAGSGTQTPVQLLAEVPPYIVTATAFIESPVAATAYDSIRPLIGVLEHDMSRTLPGLEFITKQEEVL